MQTPAQGVVMAPVSPTVAKLLHQLQAAIINERPALPPGSIVLHSPGKAAECRYMEKDGRRSTHLYYAHDASLHLSTPFIVDPDYAFIQPGVWYGTQYRTDEFGRSWNRASGDYVIDNFGELVPVGGAA